MDDSNFKSRLRSDAMAVANQSSAFMAAVSEEIYRCHDLVSRHEATQTLESRSDIDLLRRRKNSISQAYCTASSIRSLTDARVKDDGEFGEVLDDFDDMLSATWWNLPWKLKWSRPVLLSIYSTYLESNRKIQDC